MPRDLLPLGIHFNLPEDEYFADPGLGSTDQKMLAIDPVEYQHQKLHGEERDSAALLWGKALHARTLEGAHEFRSRFITAPVQDEIEGELLVTSADLKAYARKIGVKILSKSTKPEIIAAIRERDAVVKIWDEVVADFEAYAEGKTILPAETAEQIERAAQWMQRNDKLGPFMQDGTFSVGAPEVAIFVEDQGVRLRMKIDRLLPHAIVDLKSFRPRPDWRTAPEEIDKVLGRIIKAERHDLQTAAYLRVWAKAKELVDQGCIFGASAEQASLIRAAMARTDMKWIWVLVKNSGAPQCFVREFEIGSHTFRNALSEIEIGLDHYRKYVAEFGADQDWMPSHPAGKLTDEDFPNW